MSYSGRVRYKSRREKNKNFIQRFKWIIIFGIIIIAMLLYKNRYAIKDHWATYFY